MKFKCESSNKVKGNVSVGYGRGAQAGVENRAKADAEAIADRDANTKAQNEHECETGCRIRGEATNKKTTIIVKAWQDSKGGWHATAQCKWSLTVHCEKSVAAKKKDVTGASAKPVSKGKSGNKAKPGATGKIANKK